MSDRPFVDVAKMLRAMYPPIGSDKKPVYPVTKPWTASDTLWYDYRDPFAEGVPGAREALAALRGEGGWNVPHEGRIVFIPDGTNKDADAALEDLNDGSGG